MAKHKFREAESTSKAFFDIMKKYKVWDAEDIPIITNFNYN